MCETVCKVGNGGRKAPRFTGLRLTGLLLAACLALAGCQSGQEAIYEEAQSGMASSRQAGAPGLPEDTDRSAPNYVGPPPASGEAPSPVPGDGLSGELTIKTFLYRGAGGSAPAIALLAEEFMDLHPQVTVSFDYELDLQENAGLSKAERALRRESYYTRLRAGLVSGEADCLLYDFSEDLDIRHLSESGILRDLRPEWEGDPDLNSGGYFTEVLDAGAVDLSRGLFEPACHGRVGGRPGGPFFGGFQRHFGLV